MPDEVRETEKYDDPEERFGSLYDWLQTAPRVYRNAIQASLDHARAAQPDALREPWMPLGPRNVGGAVRSLAQHPARPSVWYAGTAQGGLWKSESDGYSWFPVGGPELVVPIGAVALAPGDPEIVYAGTGEKAFNTVQGAGIYKSVNGGRSFARLVGPASGPPPLPAGAANFYTRIQVDPDQPNRFWAAGETGLWRFEPGTGFVAEALPAGSRVTDLALLRDPASPANRLVLVAGVEGAAAVPAAPPAPAVPAVNSRIFRAVWDRTTPAVPAAWNPAVLPAAAATPGRVLLTFWVPPATAPAGTQPLGYAVLSGAAGLGGTPGRVLRSTDLGRNWTLPPALPAPAPAPAPPVPVDNGQAGYSMAIEADPDNPQNVLVGYVDLHRNPAGGSAAWTTVLDWTRYDAGDRAQHGDIHVIHFDLRPAAATGGAQRRMWVCNDGGISTTDDGGATWRKRSYGIVGAQFVDLTSHPVYPALCGGGMQDNGTFVSFGGPTWYRLNGGDGGQMAFDPGSHRRFFTSWQGDGAAGFTGIEPTQLIGPPVPAPAPLNIATLPDLPPPGNRIIPRTGQLPVAAGLAPTFIAVLEGHPATPNLLLIGRGGGAAYSTNGTGTRRLNLPIAFAPPPAPNRRGEEVSATAFAAPPATDMWVGTSRGQLCTSQAALPATPANAAAGVSGPAWTARPLPWPGGTVQAVAGIAVHPAQPSVVAVSGMGNTGEVFLTHDRGANWQRIRGAGITDLPPSPITSVAWDPTNPRVLFAGTVAGVYVARNLPAFAGAAALPAAPAVTPVWELCSEGLPLVQVNDLSVTAVTSTLRCATHGRGCFECNIRGATPANLALPAVRLVIRDHLAQDGRPYLPANQVPDDPRVLPAVPFNPQQAYDLRVDAPTSNAGEAAPFRPEAFAFGEAIDGVEFDEMLVPDRPVVGEINQVYVQVHNRGTGQAHGVVVHLYFADAGNPAAPPDVDAGKLNYPGEPAGDSPWKRAAPAREVGAVGPGQPVVVRFPWTPPVEIAANVALLAVCTGDGDALAAVPGGSVAAFVAGELRAALRVTAVVRDPLYIRDGVDDDGRRGLVAWGGRSPDIIVRSATVADPAAEFRALDAHHLEDRATAGTNHVYVRVTNRTQVPVNARVRLFEVPTASPAPGSTWRRIDTDQAVNGIPAGQSRFAHFTWTGVAAPAGPYGAFTLAAVASVVDAAGNVLDEFPDVRTVTGQEEFWRFFTREPLANNAAVRSLRFAP